MICCLELKPTDEENMVTGLRDSPGSSLGDVGNSGPGAVGDVAFKTVVAVAAFLGLVVVLLVPRGPIRSVTYTRKEP